MIELLMIAAMGLGGILGAIGGTGFKWARRYVLPASLGIIAYKAGFKLWRCIGLAVGLSVAFCLPYGDRTPWAIKCLVACSYAAPTLFLGISPWQIITPAAFLGLFWLSNWQPTAGMFSWKICEFLIFSLVGTTVAHLISKEGIRKQS